LWKISQTFSEKLYLSHIHLFQPFHVSTGGNKEWRVVCHGYYLDVYVVDVLTLEVSKHIVTKWNKILMSSNIVFFPKVLYTLSSSASSNWLAAACVVRPPRRQGTANYHSKISWWFSTSAMSLFKKKWYEVKFLQRMFLWVSHCQEQ
jgi:hypothetical protein